MFVKASVVTFNKMLFCFIQGRCYGGRCKTRDGQCRTLWGYSRFWIGCLAAFLNHARPSGFPVKRGVEARPRLCPSEGTFLSSQTRPTGSATKSLILRAQRKETVVRTPVVRDGCSATNSERTPWLHYIQTANTVVFFFLL